MQVQSKHGVTLVELMISMVVILLISGVLMLSYSTTMGVWRKVSSLNSAYPPAYSALRGINQDLRNAVYVVPQAASLIIYHGKIIPSTTDATLNSYGGYTAPIEIDYSDVIQYYLTNSTGSGAPNTSKTNILWCRHFTENSVSGATSINTNWPKKIAENVQNFTITADSITAKDINGNSTGTDGKTLTLYQTAITKVGTEGAQEKTSVFASNIDFRNPAISIYPPAPIF